MAVCNTFAAAESAGIVRRGIYFWIANGCRTALWKVEFYFLKKAFDFAEKKRRLVPVFSSSHTGAAVFLKGTGLSAITYGMSNKDTISLAGLDDAGASVSIQRTVRALDGTEIEPGDIRVRLKKPHSAEQVLLLSTVLLLCGETPEFRF